MVFPRRNKTENAIEPAELVSSLALSSDEQFLAIGGRHSVSIWSLPEGTLLRNLEGHTERIIGIAISPDGQRLISMSWDKTLL